MRRVVPSLVLVTLLGACNLKTVAMRSLADAVAEPGNTYARDDDPQLVAEALPVLLKIMEQLRDGLPDHKGIRLALARNFTSYGAAFIKDEADRVSESNVQRGKEVYGRARRLLLRAYGYGLEGLELSAPGFRVEFTSGNPARRAAAVSRLTKKEDVPLIFWTAAALGSAIASAKDDMNLVGELPLVEALMTRALALDETYDEGSLHEFFITYDMTRGAGRGGGPASAKRHYDRALALGQNKKLSPHVTWCEDVLVDQQNKKEFVRILEAVVAHDVDKDLEYRLVNVIAQRRARWLLSRTADLFAE